MQNQIAYLDEFGTNELDTSKEGVTTHFIVTAVLINASDYSEVERAIEQIRIKYFQKGEIKSSKVGNDDNRRIKVLTELLRVNFHIYALIVDKKELKSKGLAYKKTFYKFINGLLFKELYRTFPNLLLFADEHGSTEFKIEFAKYVNSRSIPDLFAKSSFSFLSSKTNVLVQTADFISGSIARCFDEKHLSSKKDSILELITKKILTVKIFPDSFKSLRIEELSEEGKFNPLIAELGLNLAVIIRDELADSKDDVEIYQSLCLSHLIFHFQYINPNKYVWTNELIGNIDNNLNKKISSRQFRSQVIGKLRDKGVIISSSHKGYKLPANEGDLYEFLNHSNSIIKPMIERIKICRDRIKAATKNELDILNKIEFEYLKKTLD